MHDRAVTRAVAESAFGDDRDAEIAVLLLERPIFGPSVQTKSVASSLALANSSRPRRSWPAYSNFSQAQKGCKRVGMRDC